MNFTQPQAVRGRSVLSDQYAQYSALSGFFVGFSGEVFIRNKFSLEGGVYFFTSRYQSFQEGGEGNFAKVTARTVQRSFSLPLWLKYEVLKKNNLFIYGELGGAMSFTSQHEVSISQQNIRGDQVPTVPLPVSLSPDLKKIGFSIMPGVGLKYKLGRNYILFDAQYWIGLSEQTKNPWDADNQYANAINYAFVPDNLRLNNLIFSVGYVFPIYKPKLIKK